MFHNKFSSHGVSNANMFNFTFLLVNFGEVLCSFANKLQENSNAFSREIYMLQVKFIFRLFFFNLVYFFKPSLYLKFCLSFVNNG